MGRAPKFSFEELVRHAISLAANQGPEGVTMVGVARAAGAPSGSMYHRFDSRPHLLAEVWRAALAAFQAYWWARAEDADDPGDVAVLPVSWARNHREVARVLLLHGPEDFVADECPGETLHAIEMMQRSTAKQLATMSRRFLGCADAHALERTILALTGVPLAALQRPLKRGTPITQHTEALVREAASGLMRGAST